MFIKPTVELEVENFVLPLKTIRMQKICHSQQSEITASIGSLRNHDGDGEDNVG